VVKKIKEIERKLEMKERQESKKNITIRGLEVREGKRKEMVEDILENIGAKVKMEEVKKLGGGKGKKEII